MKMFKSHKIFLFLIEILVISYVAYLILKENIIIKPLKKDYQMNLNLINRLKKENEELKKRLKYLENPENFKKELKDKFNLVEPGEKLIIFPEKF